MAGLAILDASVLIAYFEGSDPFHLDAVSTVTTAARNGDRLAANELTIAEFLVGPVRAGIADAAEASLSELGLERHEFPASYARRLAQVRHDGRVKLPDAAVLLTAIDAAAAGSIPVTVATFDARLRAAARAYGLATT